jgi:starvation-inducible DNA-binding protein
MDGQGRASVRTHQGQRAKGGAQHEALKINRGRNGQQAPEERRANQEVVNRAQPLVDQDAPEIQPYAQIIRLPIALEPKTVMESVEGLNQILADTITLRDLYKKHHWQTAGPTFYQLHLLFDKHYEEQAALVDAIAERIQMLGGISLAMAADIADQTSIPRPPKGREEVPVQISRLLHAHETILKKAHALADKAADNGDDGTNDLLISDVIRRHEMQVWFLAEHVVDVPVVRA